MKKVKAGIIGAAGYTGGELIRLLIHHPFIEHINAVSNSSSGKRICEIHTDLIGDTDLIFSGQLNGDEDVLFLCLGHGKSKEWLQKNTVSEKKLIIDLSQDFRIGREHGFVYGLPEYLKSEIAESNKIANPGCFATAIQLALLPLLANNNIRDNIHVTATTGSTGAGQALSDTVHFSWRSNNHSAYKSMQHQHMKEIMQTVGKFQPDNNIHLHFIPNRGAFTRGIHAVVYTNFGGNTEDAAMLFGNYYKEAAFCHVVKNEPDVKQVVNTNKCLLFPEVINGQIVITSVIDNLLKGASGQALQNMNIAFNFPEKSGLLLKPTAY
ncbi:MAG: N-acetyl-gamma-glutamyl-phosphate reductase [Bacteroidia bacterium]